MPGLRRFLIRLAHFLRLRRPDAEVRREIEAHVGVIEDQYVADGMSRDAARRAARIAIGGLSQAEERHRDARSFVWLEDARQDCLHGARMLRRSPLFTLTAGLSLAIGIGGNIAIFGVANQLLFRAPGGVAQPGQLVSIGTFRGDGGLNPLPAGAFDALARDGSSFDGVSGHLLAPRVMSLEVQEREAERVLAQGVTANFFSVLGARPSLGRTLMSGVDDAGAAAVLDRGYWARRFGSDPAAIGRQVRLNGQTVTIVGVAAADFQGTGLQNPNLWVAMGAAQRQGGGLMAIGRLRRGMAMAAARGEVARIGAGVLRPQGGGSETPNLGVIPYSRAEGNRNVVGFAAMALMAMVSLVFAVGCANVAGILLARSSARTREMALRAALGAGRGRLVRQLLAETVLLALIAGAMGLVLAPAFVALVRLIPGVSIPGAGGTSLDWRVLLFASSIALVSAFAAGLLPALRSSGVRPIASLKEGGPAASPRMRMRGLFVVGQVAVSVLLVVLAGLFLRALQYAGGSNPGFDVRHVRTAVVDLSMAGDASLGVGVWRDVIAQLAPLPEVESVSVAMVPPGGWEGINLGGVSAIENAAAADLFPAWNIVGPGYFSVLRIPIKAGRDFSWSDAAGAPAVIIVAKAVADRFWPGETAVGKHLRVETFVAGSRKPDVRVAAVVGVADDIKTSSAIDGLAEPYVYLPVAQAANTGMTGAMSILARGRNGSGVDREIAAAIRRVHPSLVIARSEKLDDVVALGLVTQRLFTSVAAALGLIGLLLASIGTYGVVGYAVARRRQEFGIRMALGAPRLRILQSAMAQGVGLTTAGTVIGLMLAAAASQVLSGFLYGLPPFHAPTFLVAILSAQLIAGFASYLPARRAVGVDPLSALRSE